MPRISNALIISACYLLPMDTGYIILLAIGLAMDCFAVSVTAGSVKTPAFSQRFLMALMFGLFQAIMPLVGFWVGYGFSEQIQSVDHWLAFGILFLIGSKMVYEDVKESDDDDDDAKTKDFFKWYVLLSLAVATSIDALATGLIFVPYGNLIWQAISIIGACSFLFSLLGSYTGSYLSKKIRFRAELFGGIILIVVGTKILLDHLLFS